eukprot:355066-Chlamydomonas_euryale.AAC.2
MLHMLSCNTSGDAPHAAELFVRSATGVWCASVSWAVVWACTSSCVATPAGRPLSTPVIITAVAIVAVVAASVAAATAVVVRVSSVITSVCCPCYQIGGGGAEGLSARVVRCRQGLMDNKEDSAP